MGKAKGLSWPRPVIFSCVPHGGLDLHPIRSITATDRRRMMTGCCCCGSWDDDDFSLGEGGLREFLWKGCQNCRMSIITPYSDMKF